jgi:hypothetical protein
MDEIQNEAAEDVSEENMVSAYIESQSDRGVGLVRGTLSALIDSAAPVRSDFVLPGSRRGSELIHAEGRYSYTVPNGVSSIMGIYDPDAAVDSGRAGFTFRSFSASGVPVASEVVKFGPNLTRFNGVRPESGCLSIENNSSSDAISGELHGFVSSSNSTPPDQLSLSNLIDARLTENDKRTGVNPIENGVKQSIRGNWISPEINGPFKDVDDAETTGSVGASMNGADGSYLMRRPTERAKEYNFSVSQYDIDTGVKRARDVLTALNGCGERVSTAVSIETGSQSAESRILDTDLITDPLRRLDNYITSGMLTVSSPAMSAHYNVSPGGTGNVVMMHVYRIVISSSGPDGTVASREFTCTATGAVTAAEDVNTGIRVFIGATTMPQKLLRFPAGESRYIQRIQVFYSWKMSEDCTGAPNADYLSNFVDPANFTVGFRTLSSARMLPKRVIMVADGLSAGSIITFSAAMNLSVLPEDSQISLTRRDANEYYTHPEALGAIQHLCNVLPRVYVDSEFRAIRDVILSEGFSAAMNNSFGSASTGSDFANAAMSGVIAASPAALDAVDELSGGNPLVHEGAKLAGKTLVKAFKSFSKKKRQKHHKKKVKQREREASS